VRHEAEIARLKASLSAMTESERSTLEEVTHSAFGHPILFVSHRWESVAHPDPEGRQLGKLKALENCWLIYDYSSFPQEPRSPEDDAALTHILRHMDELIDNVLLLGSPDYLRRGWCVYEYIVSSFKGSVVCDEIADPDLIALREWAATSAPIPTNLFRDGYESQQRNFINKEIVNAVNRILPIFLAGEYTEERDRTIVRTLLREQLKGSLPARKEYQPYVAEWMRVPWTDAELESAFESEITLGYQQSLSIERLAMDVPSTIEEAVRRGYGIKRPRVGDRFANWLRRLGAPVR
jgi:hypothetical protein